MNLELMKKIVRRFLDTAIHLDNQTVPVYKYGQNKLCYPINSGLYGELCYLPSE